MNAVSPVTTPRAGKRQLPPPVPYSGAVADIYLPQDGTEVKRVRMLAVDAEEPALLDRDRSFVFSRTDDGLVLHALDPHGDERFACRLPAGARVQDLRVTKSRVLVLTRDELFAFDARSGKQRGHLDLGEERGGRVIVPRPDKGLFLGGDRMLRTLDDNLSETARKDLGFDPDFVELQADGTLYVREDGYPGHVVVLDGDCEIFRHDRAALHSQYLADNGDLWFVEEGDYGLWGVRLNYVHHYDAATHRTERFSAGEKPEVAVPLATGKFLVFEDDWSSGSRVDLDSSRGSSEKTFTFGEHDRVRQLCVAADGRTAWAVVEPRGEGRKLYRLDLDEASAPAWPVYNPFNPFNPFGLPSSTPEEIFQADGRFFPAALEDGRMVVFGEQDVKVLDGEGKVIQTHSDLQSLVDALGPDAMVVSRRVDTRGSGEGAIQEGLQAHLAEAERAFHYAPPRGSSAEPSLAADGCVAFTDLVPAALVPTPPADAAMPTMDLILRSQVDLPHGDGGGSLELSPRSLVVRGGREQTAVTLDDGSFTAALPLHSDRAHYGAAGTSAGEVMWVRAGDRDYLSFDLEQPVQALSLPDPHRVMAVGAEGAILLLKPALGDGEHLLAPAPKQKSDGHIEQSEDVVIIGGVAVPRRR